MKATKYFTLPELLASETALYSKIPNLPTFAEVENLNTLIVSILDPVRSVYGSPIKVTSGYRCTRLNEAVGGVKNSQHLSGLAADLIPVDGDLERLKQTIITTGVPFDQLIEEQSGKTKWIHVSIAPTGKGARHQILNIKK